MIATELHDRITAELDRLEAIEGAATKGPWIATGKEGSPWLSEIRAKQHVQTMTCYDANEGRDVVLRFDPSNMLSSSSDHGFRTLIVWPENNANLELAALARNSFRPMLAFMRQQADDIMAKYEGQAVPMVKLSAIAAALGVEVGK